MLNEERMLELMAAPCYWCGIVNGNTGLHKVTASLSGAWPHNGIDRLFSDHGYIEGNVVSSCGRCNKAKLSMTPDEFLAMCRQVVVLHGPLTAPR